MLRALAFYVPYSSILCFVFSYSTPRILVSYASYSDTWCFVFQYFMLRVLESGDSYSRILRFVFSYFALRILVIWAGTLVFHASYSSISCFVVLVIFDSHSSVQWLKVMFGTHCILVPYVSYSSTSCFVF
jgi:hypothetical protein